MELKKKSVIATEVSENRSIYFFIANRLYLITGRWQWALQSHELFCSDVITAPGNEELPGAKCLIYPEDIHLIQKLIERSNSRKGLDTDFRVITSYGRTETIKALGLFECVEEEGFLQAIMQQSFQQYAKEKVFNEQYREQSLQLKAYQYAESICRSGIWYLNTATQQIFYSDEVFRIHGLPSQSLNAHIHTFHSFIHPDEKEMVIQAFENAYAQTVPLHLEYRILVGGTEIRHVRQITKWLYNEKGENILSGVLENLTESRNKEEQYEKFRNELMVKENMLSHAETVTRMANWHLNLLTRKIVYSDQVYRLYGIKASDVPLNAGTLMNYVHPEDREKMLEANRQILYEHVAPEVEYRIIRPDGKMRYLRQRGKLIVDTHDEMVMIGTIVDRTEQELGDKKLAKARTELELRQFSSDHAEEKNGSGSWTWNLNSGEIFWSKGMYELLGFKSVAVQLTQRVLLSFIHPNDKKLFTDNVSLMLNGGQLTDFTFRINKKNEIKYLNAFFKLVNTEDQSFFIASLQDKTAEMALQKKLAEQANMGDMLSDASLDRIVITDSNNYILRWNRKCEEDYGIKKEKALGKNIFDVFPQLRIPEIIGRFQQVLHGETVYLKDTKAVLNTGYHNLLMVPVKDENEEVIAVLNIIHDTSQEHELRQQLTSRLQFIQKLLEASVDRIIVLDQNMNYQYWNRKAEEYYGISKEEVIGKNILELFPAFINDPSYGEFRKALRGEIVHIPAIKNLEDKKGYFETYLIPIKGDKEETTGVLWIVHDLVGEYQLAQQQRKANHILETINEAYVEVDFTGELRFLNHKAEEFWKVKKEEVLGQPITDVFFEAREADTMKALETSLKEKKDVRGEFFAPVTNRWIYLSCTVRPEGVIMLFYDITEAKQAEAALAGKQQLLQATMDSSTDMIQVFEAVRNERGEIVDFRYLLLNHEAEKWMPDVVGKTLLQVQPGVLEEGIFDAFKQVVETGTPQQYEKRYVHEQFDGWFYQSAVKLNDGVATTTTDITQRKLAEQEVWKLKDEIAQKATDKYKALFDSIDEGFAIQEVVTDENGNATDVMYLEVNRAFEQISGMKDVAGRKASELLPHLEQHWLDTQTHIYKTGKPLRGESYSADLGKWITYQFSRIGGEGSALIGAVFNDITERKQREEHQQFLIKFSDALRAELDANAIANRAIKVLAEHLRLDRCYVGIALLDDNRAIFPYQAGNEKVPPMPEEGVSLSDFPEALRKTYDETLVITDFQNTEGLTETEKQNFAALGFGALIVANVRKEEKKPHWSINAVSATPRNWTALEIQLIEEVTERTWNAVERARAEEALHQSREELKNFNFTLETQIAERTSELQKNLTILQHTEELAQTGSWEYQIAAGEFIWSEGMYRLFGLPQQIKVRPEIYLDFAAEEDRSVAKRIIKNLKKTHEPFEETMCIRKEGSMRELKIKASVVRNEKGEAQKMVGVDLDITDIKEAEQKVAETRHWLEQTAQASPDAITIYGLQKKEPVYLNNCLAEWTGKTVDELTGMGIEGRLKLIHPDDRLKLLHFIEKTGATRDNEILSMEYRIYGKEGNLLWIQNRSKIFKRDKEGKVTHILSLLQDVTEAVKMREELKRRTEYAESIIDASIDRIAVYDQQFKVLAWNRRSEEVTGVRKENILGKALIEVFPKIKDDAALYGAYTEALKGRFVSLPAKLGVYSNYYYERFFLPLKNEAGEIYAVVNIMHDVSELVHRHRELHQLNSTLEQKNKELQEKNEEITSFAFIASHDLKEPLRKIHTFSDWLLNREAENLSATGRGYIKKIANSIKRMDMLIEDVLVLTKVDAEKKLPKPVDLNAVLERVRVEMKDKIEAKGAELLAETLPIVNGHDNQLFYLFKNLVSNGLKFQSGTATPVLNIRTEQVGGELLEEERGRQKDYYKISFEDNGIGIEEKYFKKIFMVFQRLHGSSEFEGTGMGLAICKKIMENHGGLITVQSTADQGSVFNCYFPVQ